MAMGQYRITFFLKDGSEAGSATYPDEFSALIFATETMRLNPDYERYEKTFEGGKAENVLIRFLDKGTSNPIKGAFVAFKAKSYQTNAEGIIGPFDLMIGERISGLFTHPEYESLEWITTVTFPNRTYDFKMKRTAPAPVVGVTLKDQWDDFFKHPDIIKALGLTPSSVQESFSLVFSNYSIINDREQSPETGDYASVYLILGGLTLLAATGVYALLGLLPSVGVGGMMKGSASIGKSVSAAALKKAAAQLAAAVPGSTVAGLAAKLVSSPWFAIITVANLTVLNAWNFTDPMWWWGAEVKMTGDVKKRFESLRIDVNKKLQQAYALVYIDPDATKLASARTLLRATKPLIMEMFNLLTGLEIDVAIKEKYPEFEESVKASVTQYNDLVVAAGGINEDFLSIAGLMTPAPELPVTFPEEFELEDVQVIDGDSLAFPGHPEAKNEIRMLGVFAHEIETEAGKVEAEYLKSLIENRTVTIKTHQHHDPEMVLGTFGRLLGGVFLGDQDIALAMLERFGKTLYPPSKYRKTYRWIDWDEYKRVADAAKGPEVKEFKIYIDSKPTRAKLHIDGKYTHHLTPSNEVELKDVMDMLEPGKHVIMASKAGLEGSVEVDVVEGVNPDVLLVLQVKGLEEIPPGEIPPEEVVPEVEFKINILSTPSRAKLYVDGIYTHHLTPSNEKELRDVMHLLTPGKHTLKATRSGKSVEQEVDIKAGYNEPIYMTLKVIELPRTREEIEREISKLEEQAAALRAELEKL